MSQFEIEVIAEVELPAAYQEVVRQAAESALVYEGQEDGAGCTILLTSDERVRELNKDFLGIDKVTDVLSFPSGEPMPGAPSYLGDIAISVLTAELQAEQGDHSVSAELQLLTVHAVLHLLGYDHASEAEKTEMWSSQAEILIKIGSEVTGPKIS